MSEPAAWYGKLPTLGDFASRRLGPGFIEPWDAWLADGLGAWRSADDGWLQAYLAGPSWRFLLEPGALVNGSPVLAGVLMPSVDSAGRYFPLTLVQPLPRLPASAAALQALLAWMHRLDDLAVDALHDDWTPAQLEAELAALGGVGDHGKASGNSSSSSNLSNDTHSRDAAATAAAALPDWAQPLAHSAQQPARRSWWWCTAADGAPHLFHTTGLPRHPTFTNLLSGELAALGSGQPATY